MSQATLIRGVVYDSGTKKPLNGVSVALGDLDTGVITDQFGGFELRSQKLGSTTLSLRLPEYQKLSFELLLDGSGIDLGELYMEYDLDAKVDLVLIKQAELELDENFVPNTGTLSAGTDILINRAAFDLNQAFFRIRGYDSGDGNVHINGISINRMLNGRPQWSNWGGMNDVFRNRSYQLGLIPSEFGFGGILGISNLDTRPSSLRPGLRFTSSISNRSYRTRIMASYNRTPGLSGWGYSFALSRRWGKEGYISGTPYDAYSFYGSLERRFNEQHGIHLTAFSATNTRGRNSAITSEVYDLMGGKYNPNWGVQDSEMRISKLRAIKEPVLMLNYYRQTQRFDINVGVAYQWGTQSNSRIGYYNAPNPNPDHYQNLPVYFINSPVGANFNGARMAEEAFIEEPQINWALMYQSNKSITNAGRASYLFYDDIAKEQSLRAHMHLSRTGESLSRLVFGLNYENSSAEFFSRIKDLLGASYHLDKDPFSDTYNNLDGNSKIGEGELFGYNYSINYDTLDLYASWQYIFGKYNAYVAATFYNTNIRREGIFRNERFPESSEGLSEPIGFSNYGIKAGISYELNKRHKVEANGSSSFRPPVVQNIFINPRENNRVVDDISDERVTSFDLTYRLDLPDLKARLTAYLTRFQNTTDINFFFVHSGLGSDFVQEVITGLDRLNKGMELALVYKPTSTISISAASSFSRYEYASDPDIKINFDTAGPEEDLINVEGVAELGTAKLKGMNYAAGPAQAYSLGLEYRDPKYWRIGITMNYLKENYIRLSPIRHTPSFMIDPETAVPFPDATPDNLNQLLDQKPLDEVYLLNLTFGKSWLWKKKYLSLFVSVSNLLNAEFISGGYEQSRNGNYGQAMRDQLSGRPSFGPKYWYGYGRTYFVNFSISL